MDAVTYFFINLGLHNFLLALLAFLLGLLLGWWLWAKYKNQFNQLNGELTNLRNSRDELQVKLDECHKTCKKLENTDKPANPNTISVEKADDPRKKSLDFFAAGLASGKVRRDEKLGLLYSEAPEVEDDLTKINGVARVLEKSLNNFGIYTYRQVALWEKDTVEEFSEQLAFPGRVERDDWIGQCKKFHEEKYNEKI